MIQCFGDNHRIISLLWLAASLFRMLDTYSKACKFLLMKKALRWMPVITSIVCWTIILFKAIARLLVVLTFREWYLSGWLYPRSSLVESWSVANPVPFRWILAYFLDRVFIPRSSLLESIDLFVVICTQTPLFLFWCPLTCSSRCSSVRGGQFKLSFTRTEMLLTIFLFQGSDHHILKSGAVF